jgi:hypothetical protein
MPGPFAVLVVAFVILLEITKDDKEMLATNNSAERVIVFIRLI